MQINNSRYNVSFSSNPLCKVRLASGVKANIAEVLPKNPIDNEAVTKLLKNWIIKDGSNDYIKTLRNEWNNFNNGYRYFVIELLEKGKSLSDRIVAIACTHDTKRKIKPHKFDFSKDNTVKDFGPLYLQSINSTQGNKKVGGAGELLIYGLVKLAKKYHFDIFNLISTNNGFYQKIGLKNDLEKYGDSSFFVLNRCDYDSFLSKVEKKYNFNR